ncbi:MAG: hypothetical protein ACJ74G_04810 [Blastocatellia bacterium]
MPRQSKKKSYAQLQAENSLLRRGNVAQSVTSVIISAIKWGAFCFIVWSGYLSIKILAGQQTQATIAVSFLGNIKISEALAYALAAGGIIGWRRERGLRKKTVKRIHVRTKKLETERDPLRTSSRLTPAGETHPRDED